MKLEKDLPYDRLVHRLVKRLNTSYPSLTQDLIQIGRLAVLQALATYDPLNDGGVAQVTWVYQYVFRDVVRALEDEHKHQNDHDDINDMLDDESVEELIDYDHQDRIQLQVDVFNMLSAMPEPERRMVVAHLFDDLSYTEIAYANSLNKQAVYRIVTQGMQILREKFS